MFFLIICMHTYTHVYETRAFSFTSQSYKNKTTTTTKRPITHTHTHTHFMTSVPHYKFMKTYFHMPRLCIHAHVYTHI